MAIQGFYKRNRIYTVVRAITLTSKTKLPVGTELPNKDITLRGFQMRSLFQRGYIGLKDSAWTKARLSQYQENLTPEPTPEPEPEPEPTPKKKPRTKKQKTKTEPKESSSVPWAEEE